jgi:hypothetical protein
MESVFSSIIACVVSSILLVGCNSVSTFNYRTSQNVIRSAVAENDSPKELQGNALVLLITDGEKAQNVSIKHEEKQDHGQATIDGDSFAAFIVSPGIYRANNLKITIEPDKCYFFVVKDGNAFPMSMTAFQKQCNSKYLVEHCLYFGGVQNCDSYFSDKVSGWEVAGHNIGVVIGTTFIVLGVIVLAGGLVFLALVEARSGQNTTVTTVVNEIHPNAYGPGIHSDEYGRPVKVVPAY